MNRTCRVVPWMIVTLALGAVLLALGGNAIGIDADREWGPDRTMLLVSGLVVIAAAAGARILAYADEVLLRRRAVRKQEAEISAIGEAPPPSSRKTTAFGRTRLLSVFGAALIVELVFVWFVSVGRLIEWPPTTEYFAMLGESIRRGRIDLLIDPPPELAGLEDPYPVEAREGIPVLGDAIYFGGRYYLYWGPVPGALSGFWSEVAGIALGDQHLTFLGSSLAFLSSALVLVAIQRRAFPSLPAWLLVAGIIAAGFSHPMLWNLSGGAVYEAAIAFGQAFLLAGLFLALPAITGDGCSPARLALASACWGLALGSRLTLAPAIAALVVVTSIQVLRSRDSGSAEKAVRILALGLPVISTVTILGLYNFARFGSVFETGFRYTLTPHNLGKLQEEGGLFSASYLVSNLLYYGLAPVLTRANFPFVSPLRAAHTPFTTVVRLVGGRATVVEDITGLLVAAPILFFLAYLAWDLACGWPRSTLEARFGAAPSPDARRYLGRTTLALVLVGGFASASTLLYFFTASRFAFDYSMVLVIASVAGAWLLHARNSDLPLRGWAANALIAGVFVTTLVTGVLLAMSGPASKFDDYNPVLWRWLESLSW